MYKIRSPGFTLIELLVVIAIIGILSAVVLASLNTARSKGSDAAIQSNLSTVQVQSEIFYGGTGVNTYTGLCADPQIAKATLAANTVNGAGTMNCLATATAYAVSAQMVADTAKWWCVDSIGNAKAVTVNPGAVTVCPP